MPDPYTPNNTIHATILMPDGVNDPPSLGALVVPMEQIADNAANALSRPYVVQLTGSDVFDPDPWIAIGCTIADVFVVAGGNGGNAGETGSIAGCGGSSGFMRHRKIELARLVVTGAPYSVGAAGAGKTSTGSPEIGGQGGGSTFGSLDTFISAAPASVAGGSQNSGEGAASGGSSAGSPSGNDGGRGGYQTVPEGALAASASGTVGDALPTYAAEYMFNVPAPGGVDEAPGEGGGGYGAGGGGGHSPTTSNGGGGGGAGWDIPGVPLVYAEDGVGTASGAGAPGTIVLLIS